MVLAGVLRERRRAAEGCFRVKSCQVQSRESFRGYRTLLGGLGIVVAGIREAADKSLKSLRSPLASRGTFARGTAHLLALRSMFAAAKELVKYTIPNSVGQKPNVGCQAKSERQHISTCLRQSVSKRIRYVELEQSGGSSHPGKLPPFPLFCTCYCAKTPHLTARARSPASSSTLPSANSQTCSSWRACGGQRPTTPHRGRQSSAPSWSRLLLSRCRTPATLLRSSGTYSTAFRHFSRKSPMARVSNCMVSCTEVDKDI